MSAREMLAFNPMLKTIRHILPGATDPDDCYLYPLVAPPQIRPDTERRPVHSGSFLCHVCHGALEYLAYVLEECRSKRSTADDLNLLEVAAHYQNVAA